MFFSRISALKLTCMPAGSGSAGDQHVREYFSRCRVEFEADGPVEFHLTHGHWIGLLKATGFVVDALIEVRPDADALPRFELVSIDWARRWPSEEIWIAHKAG